MKVFAERTVGEHRVCAVQADITRLDVDVVVNAANEQLAHGGGVALAIARAGAPEVQAESDVWVATHGPVRPGGAAVTSAGSMPASHVVHVVGPRYREGQDNAGMLQVATVAALESAASLDARSVAFPAISAGIFGYPPEKATQVLADAACAWLAGHPGSMEVLLVGYDEAMAARFGSALQIAETDTDAH